MAFDGIMTAAVVRELKENILLGKIDKIYQPEPDELVLNIYTKNGVRRLYSTVNSAAASVRFVDKNPVNPPAPLNFCMLMRKQLLGGRIVAVEQKDSERIIEIFIETMNELEFKVSRKLIFEMMGRHSNIILVDYESGKIVDSIKHVSIDVNRARQLLPGKKYEYPPAQDKKPFKEASPDDLDNAGDNGKAILASIGGISPAFARELALNNKRFDYLRSVMDRIAEKDFYPVVYIDDNNTPREFYCVPLTEYEETCEPLLFDSLSGMLGYYYENRDVTNRVRQKSHNLVKSVSARLDKLYLKKQRLLEDLLKAENSEDLRLYGELLTANIHRMKTGMKEITVTNYYDGTSVTIPLDPRFPPNKNAQNYFKRYGKMKTAIKEKNVQLEETGQNIDYLESVLTYLNNTDKINEIDELRTELEEQGFVRARKQSKRKKKKFRPSPIKYRTSDGFEVLVGRNNKENDYLTTQLAAKTDLWLHTKDIPGSHVIVRLGRSEATETTIFEAAGIAAYHSKARASENVPVDYVKIRHVKKPAGAKPGMVIFTDNKTVYVNPALSPADDSERAADD